MANRTLTSSLVVRLIDQVTGPAKTVGRSILGLEKASKGAGNFGQRLGKAIERNNAALADARGGMVDAIAGFYTLKTAIGGPIQQAMKFEDAMADIAKVSGFDTAGLDAYGKRLRKLAVTEIPLAVNDLAALSAAAAQAGVPDEDLFDFTRLVAKAAVAWEMSGAEAGEALAKIRTALGLTNEQTAAYADAINYVSDSTASSSRDLIDFSKRVASQGEFFGFAKEQTLAFGAAMISAGSESEVAATSFRNMGRALTRGASATKAQRGAYARLGLDAKKVAKAMQKDAVGTTLKVIEKLGQLPEHMQASVMSDLFGDEARALAPLLNNVDLLRKALALTADEQKYLNSVGKEFEKRAATSSYKLQRFKSQLSDIALTVGGALLPALNQIIGPLGEIALRFADWAEANPELVRNLILATSALIGFRVAASALRYAGLVGRGGALQLMSIGFNGLSRATAGLGGGIRRIREVVALQNALGAAHLGRALTGWEKFGVIFRAVAAAGGRLVWTLTKLSLVGIAIGAVATWIWNNWQNLANFFSGFVEGFTKNFEGFGPALEPIVTGFGDLFKWVSGLLGPIEDTNGAFKSWGETVGGVVAGAVNSVIGAIEKLIGGIRSAVEWAASLKSKLGGLMTWGGGDGSVEIPSYDAMGNPTGHRATGGPVWPGGSFVVGDGGEPEIFTPKTAGTITPMSKAGGSKIQIGPFNIDGSADPVRLANEIAAKIEQKLDDVLRGSHADSGAYA